VSSKFNKSQDKFVIYRQNGKCGNCGKNLSEAIKIELHHILNQKDGGAGIVENAVMLCGECHLHIHDYNTKKSVLIFRDEFKYANWDKNSEYKGRKKGKKVESTKETLNQWDKYYKGITMSNNQNYEYHLQLIEDLTRNLSTLNEYLGNLKGKYNKQIKAMDSAGFFDNYITPLQERHQQFKHKINDIEEMITRHKLQILQQKEALEHLIADARG